LGISLVLFVIILFAGNLLALPFKAIPYLGKQVALPLDIIISRIIEIMVSIPTLFLIIGIVAIVKPNIFWVMVVIGFTSWMSIARFIRAELLRVRSLEYIEAARALGFSGVRILMKHAIPNGLTAVLISIAFGIASAILVESFLSFLGLGVAADTITWGKLLSFARQSPSAWWLAIFPGFAIFITVTVFNLIGEGLTDALDPRLKS
jgi:peptide/nickel transport system permease protein